MVSPQYGTGVLASAVAEFIGSFYFVFFSCASTTFWPQGSKYSVLPVAALSGLALAVVTHCTSTISNGFVNPVVSVSLYLTQRICRLRFFLYLSAQILGGLWKFKIARKLVLFCGLTTIQLLLASKSSSTMSFVHWLRPLYIHKWYSEIGTKHFQ